MVTSKTRCGDGRAPVCVARPSAEGRRHTMRSRWVALLALVAALSLVAAACGDDGTDEGGANGGGAEPTVPTLEEGVLLIGSDIPYPPFEYREGGTEVGFDMDLIREIADRLGLEVRIVDTDFATIFTQLSTARFDVVIAASTITPKREESVNFSIPYYNSQQSLTVQAGSGISTVEDLQQGMVVGVQKRTTGEAWALENVPEGVEVRSFPEGPDGYTALEAGQVDAVINDEPVAIAEIANREGLELAETIPTGEAYGIAVNPANAELLAAVNDTLEEIVADGTYDAIYAKYGDLPPGGSVAASD
jgi:polar amino acid transport system substrate-binding protein